MIQEKINKLWMCDWEKLLKQTGVFVLVHDGQNNPGQFVLPPEEVRFYTRTYRMILGGQPVNTWVKFRYDLREEEVALDVTYREPKVHKSETMILKPSPKGVNSG